MDGIPRPGLTKLEDYMKSSNMTCGLIVSFILIFGTAALGHADAIVTVSPSGNGQFVVQGDGFAGVEGVQIDIQYDATALANPRVAQGSLIFGMPMVPPFNSPGLLRYSGTDPFPKVRSGSGTLATITFDIIGDPTAPVTASTTLKDSNGSILPVQTIVVPIKTASAGARAGFAGGGPGVSGGSGTDAASGASPPATTGTANPTYLGTVTMPDTGTAAAAKTSGEASSVTPEAEKTQKQATDAAAKETGPLVAKAVPQTATEENDALLTGSVLERFRVFQGERSPQSLIALFRSGMAGNSQQPPLALSDGKATVKVLISFPAASKSEPEFAFREAKLVSLNKSGASAWVVELLPNKGTLDASVIVMQDGKMAELSLTVAPPLATDPKTGQAKALTEADFAAFLKQRGTGDGGRSDLNNDGKHDYIDDYIYTANFLAQRDAAKTEKPQGAKP